MMLLTRVPVMWLLRADQPEPLNRCVWAFVPVGAVVGTFGGIVFCGCASVGFPPSVAAIITIAAQVVLCGGFHEDGLADFFDGLGGRTQERRLEIMRDSRIGSFGVLSLVLGLGLKAATLANLPHLMDGFAALVVSGAGGRAAMTFVVLSLPPVRQDGLAHELHSLPVMPAGIMIAFAVLATMLLLPLPAAILITVCAGMVAMIMTHHLRRSLGGHTGDTLGATAALAEILILTLASIQ